MSDRLRIYLDACCLNRPFDNQTQPRIALETQAILTIINQCELGQWKPIASAALDAELVQTPDIERLKNIQSILSFAKIRVNSSEFIETRPQELVKLGFSGYDATHIASVERSNADVFLSTDDRLINRANRNIKTINVAIQNPVQWLMTVNPK